MGIVDLPKVMDLSEDVEVDRTDIEFILFFCVLVDIDLILMVVDYFEEIRERGLMVEEGEPEEIVFWLGDLQQSEDGEETVGTDEVVLEREGVD